MTSNSPARRPVTSVRCGPTTQPRDGVQPVAQVPRSPSPLGPPGAAARPAGAAPGPDVGSAQSGGAGHAEEYTEPYYPTSSVTPSRRRPPPASAGGYGNPPGPTTAASTQTGYAEPSPYGEQDSTRTTPVRRSASVPRAPQSEGGTPSRISTRRGSDAEQGYAQPGTRTTPTTSRRDTAASSRHTGAAGYGDQGYPDRAIQIRDTATPTVTTPARAIRERIWVPGLLRAVRRRDAGQA